MTRRNTRARCVPLMIGAALLLGTTIARADVRAGVTAWEAGNYTRAITEWRPLALAGNADAQFNLGQAYKLGRGVAQDLPQAVVWFRRAADQAHVQAQDNLGLVLYDLARQNEALPWLELSAARGEPRTQFVLAAELFNGRTMPRDWVRAYALMKRASDAGLERASRGLVQMDQYIPLEQRRAGLELAQQMITTEGQARLAAMTAAAGPRLAAAPPTIRPAEVPASLPGTDYTPPALPGEAAAPTSVASAPRITPAPRPDAAPVAAAAAPAAAPAAAAVVSSRWRIQLGAFSAESGARQLWTRLAPRLSGAGAEYVRAGAVVRLQAGPYASRAAAETACAAVRPQACFAVSR